MSTRAMAFALLTMVSLTGCTQSGEDPDAASRAESLWSSRVHYVGDNSRVLALVNKIGAMPEGSYRLRLQTAAPPYGLTLDLERPDKPLDASDFSESATLLLALVGNLDEVSVTSGGDVYTLTAAEATEDLGYDVKEMGQDHGKLTEYVGARSD